MKSNKTKICKWALGGLIIGVFLAGCAGMNSTTGAEAPGQGEAAVVEELPPSIVIVETPTETTAPQELDPPSGFVHTVSLPGETLSLIAKWYTGRLSNWQQLAAANPEIDPNRIFVGNEILIPKDLLTTREPLPQSFLDENYTKKKSAE